MHFDDLPAPAAIRAAHFCEMFPDATPTIEEAEPGVYVLHLREADTEVCTAVLWPDLRTERSHAATS